MPILSVTNITKSYAAETILENVSFHVEAGEKVGIVGVNGAGKTTLLNILSGEQTADSGNVFIPNDVTIGYLRQSDDFSDEETIMDVTRRIYSKYERMESELSELSQRIAIESERAESSDAKPELSQRISKASERTDKSDTKPELSALSKTTAIDSMPTGKTHAKSESGIYEDDSDKKQKETKTNSFTVDALVGKGDEAKKSAVLLARYGELQDRFRDEGGYEYKSKMRGILAGMAFGDDYLDKKIGTLSGGERTRLALACLLMKDPDLLLLDEPTNHLDIGMLKWLEQFLRSYRGAILIVSHDRYFLDSMTEKTFEIEHNKLNVYNGGYSEYAEKKREQREADLKAYSKQQTEIKRQEDIIRKFKERGTEHLAKRAASREKQLEHMERIERPGDSPGAMTIRFHEKYKSGNDIFIAEDISASYETVGRNAFDSESSAIPTHTVFTGVDLDIKRGERICIVGRNGIGKTTLLKILSGEIEKSSGYLKRGTNLDIGYYDQRQERLDPSKTVMDEIHDSFRLYKDCEIRGFLGRFLFKGDSVFETVCDLSGGEKARLALLKLMMSGANVLLLDEPTNHLDIESKEVFEEALLAYPGTVIAVSHDRYFLNKIATSIYELDQGGITKFAGGYDYYEEKKAEVTSANRYLKDMRGGTQDNEAYQGKDVSKTGARSLSRGKPGVYASDPKCKEIESHGKGGFDYENLGKRSRDEASRGLEKRDNLTGDKSIEGAYSNPAPGSREERALQKKREAEERRRRRRIEVLEREIDELEKQSNEIEQKMTNPEIISDSARLAELSEKLDTINKKLEIDYEEWGGE